VHDQDEEENCAAKRLLFLCCLFGRATKKSQMKNGNGNGQLLIDSQNAAASLSSDDKRTGLAIGSELWALSFG